MISKMNPTAVSIFLISNLIRHPELNPGPPLPEPLAVTDKSKSKVVQSA
jgi:hypothetical protein